MLEWNSKCLLPLREPNFERDITISIEQNVGGKNELISRTVLDVEDAAILEADWYNLYGAHWDLTKYPSLRAANHFVAKQMNSALIEPTCFRGQIRLKCEVNNVPPGEDPKTATAVITEEHREPVTAQSVENAKYMIHCDIYGATNVPNGEYRVRIQCGSQFSPTRSPSKKSKSLCLFFSPKSMTRGAVGTKLR